MFYILIMVMFAACLSMPAEGTTIKQPGVPDNYKELPFIDNNPAPVLNSSEKQLGYIVFHRPITAPVYPNTKPLKSEKTDTLIAFATPGEFEPLTFSIYPTRPLNNFNIRISDFKSAENHIISSTNVDIRLVTYWNMGYPRYTSRTTYRRVPELLEKTDTFSSPAYECERWWLTVHVPKNTTPGTYHAKISLHDDSGKDKTLHVKFVVFDFSLLSDPRKHFSAYMHIKNRIQYAGKSNAEADRILNNEFHAMRDMGLNMCPTFYLRADMKTEKIYLPHEHELEMALTAGLKGPVPVLGGNAIGEIYVTTTPGGKRQPHWKITKMPPPEFYTKVRNMFAAFNKYAKNKGWPELICCPLDEVSPSSREFGSKVYKAIHDSGMRTYITKNPLNTDAVFYKDGVDIWCSQPYAVPYEKIIQQHRYEYWSYPNHNAGELKNRTIMCKGGRMTYGYGFWRSGYTTLIPWHWAWVMRPGQFDYLRSPRSGCGQRLDKNGQVIPSIYWECFREGIDDQRYIYTLEQKIWERENTTNPQCKKLVLSAKNTLQQLWDSINVRKKYLREGMWNPEEFNARRLQLAQYITALQKYPATRTGIAPSVIISPNPKKQNKTKNKIIKDEIKKGNVEITDLSYSFKNWKNETPEGTITNVPDINNRSALRWIVNVNHQSGEKGYPVGWPRIRCYYKNPPLDFTKYDYLKYMIRVNSNRNEVDDDTTLLGFTIKNHNFYEVTKDIGGRQNVWLPIMFDINELIENSSTGIDPWKNIDMLQIFISEKYYKDKTQLIFDIGSAQLLHFKNPILTSLDVPAIVILPKKEMAIKYKFTGNLSNRNKYYIKVSLLNNNGKCVSEKILPINNDRKQPVSGKTDSRQSPQNKIIVLDTGTVTPGDYTLHAELIENEEVCSSLSLQQKFIAVNQHL